MMVNISMLEDILHNVTFLNGEPKNGFNNDGDHSFVSLNGDNSLEYKIGKKVKMLIPNRTR